MENIRKKVFLKIFLILVITFEINLYTICMATENNKIHFISTGGSDAFLIESNGHFGLIDSSNPPYGDGTQQGIYGERYTVTHVIKYLNSIGVKKYLC